MKIPKADVSGAKIPKADSSWLAAERQARHRLVLVRWPEVRPLPLLRPAAEPEPEPDQSLIDFVTSSNSTGFMAAFAITICAQLDGLPGTLVGLCLGLVILYLAWRRDQD